MHRADGDRDLVEALQVRGDAASPEMVVLAQVEHLADDLGGRGMRKGSGDPRLVHQTPVPELLVTPFPLVERLPGDPEMPTCPGHVAVSVRGERQEPQPPRHLADLLCFRHGIPASAAGAEQRA